MREHKSPAECEEETLLISRMKRPTFRTFSFLLLSSVCIELPVSSWGFKCTSQTSFSEKNRFTCDSSFFLCENKFWNKRETSIQPLSVLNSTQKAKKAKSAPAKQPAKVQTEAARASTRPPETPIPILDPKSFKKLPQWDFEDVYNQDASPRPTTCGRSLRLSEDKSFRESFLPNIRLFLHKDNINMSEWNRLSHFNNPFGFMGYKYEYVMPSLKLIPKPEEPLLRWKPGGDGCISCAVVGTAGILSGSKMGTEIDAHDFVFRMNGAVINGHEDDVGRRTSVYVHTARSITTSLRLLKQYGYTAAPHDEGIKYVMIPESLWDFSWLRGLVRGEAVLDDSRQYNWPRDYYSSRFNESHFYVLHQDFLRYVRNRFLKFASLNTSHWSVIRPTTGAFTLFLALHSCDIVSAYGFMTKDYNKYSNYYFEKNMTTNVVFHTNHDYNLEKDTWAKLHHHKIIRLYQRHNVTKQHRGEERE